MTLWTPDDLPEGITPMPGGLPGGCAECGGPVHVYETDLTVREDGKFICGRCTRARDKRRGPDLRSIVRNFFWRHGHDPMDDDAHEDSPYKYINIEQTQASAVNQRDQLKGGPETPFRCAKCGANLRAAASKSAGEILAPTGYRPEVGKVPPREPVVALACPNDSADDKHPVVQIRESFLKLEMARARGRKP